MRHIGEPVSECSICGLDFPESKLQRHYKTGRLVDALCADEPGADDYLEKVKQPIERRRVARQRVPPQEVGYNAVEWSTVTALADVWVEVVGNTKAGIVTVMAGVVTAGPLFQVTFGTALPAVPSDVMIQPWDPNAELAAVAVDTFDASSFVVNLVSPALQSLVTYQWRYQVRR